MKMLVTSALAYANGPLHLGHMVEHIQADIWVRFQRMKGKDCIFISGEDAHGTPIMISAEKQGLTPEELIKKISEQHQADFKEFFISFDQYYTTHSPENRELATLIYQRLKENGDIEERVIEQAFDPLKNIFLPDRYVKGECPRCNSPDQYGDNCEVCGATYSPTELKNPKSVLSGATPVQKQSLHYFFDLQHYHQPLKEWIQSEHLQDQVANKLLEWFEAGLHPWDISRDAPYFGFEIPDAPNKYFYVWLDAPIGYMASFQKYCEQHPQTFFNDYWESNSNTELYHFIGKDIIYFHGLFWPAMLLGSGFRTPSAIFTHGFLTINNQKMSKSRGTFITARQYLDFLDPEYLRYYFAAKLNNRVEDIDLNFSDFTQRVNADLVGKVINIASRCAGFIQKLFDNVLADKLDQPTLYDEFVTQGEKIAALYQNRETNQAIREIMALADRANQYIDSVKPWKLAKENIEMEKIHQCCTLGLNLFKILITYLKPILPRTASKSEHFLNCGDLSWNNYQSALLSHRIENFQPLLQRIDPLVIEQLLANAKV